MHIRVVIEFDAEAKSYAAYCPELPGCTSCGDTEEEAQKNIQEAIDLYLEPTPLKLSDKATVRELTI